MIFGVASTDRQAMLNNTLILAKAAKTSRSAALENGRRACARLVKGVRAAARR